MENLFVVVATLDGTFVRIILNFAGFSIEITANAEIFCSGFFGITIKKFSHTIRQHERTVITLCQARGKSISEASKAIKLFCHNSKKKKNISR